jgi:hypothetical protein
VRLGVCYDGAAQITAASSGTNLGKRFVNCLIQVTAVEIRREQSNNGVGEFFPVRIKQFDGGYQFDFLMGGKLGVRRRMAGKVEQPGIAIDGYLAHDNPGAVFRIVLHRYQEFFQYLFAIGTFRAHEQHQHRELLRLGRL